MLPIEETSQRNRMMKKEEAKVWSGNPNTHSASSESVPDYQVCNPFE
jgi:hypothetical protein